MDTVDKWNKPENTRDITGCIGEIIQNWEPYLGTYKSFKNTATADIYIASHNTSDSNPATWESEMNDKQYKVLGETSKTKYKILDRPWRLPPSKLKCFLDSPAIGESEIVCVCAVQVPTSVD